MGLDEDKNNFNGGGNPPATPVVPNPRTQFNNRLGMRPARSLSAKEELDRISADSNPNATAQSAGGDIILGATPKPKKNKKGIILVVLLVLAIIIAVTSAVLIKNKTSGNGNGGTDQPVETSKKAFNKLFHYIADRSDNDADISTDDMSNFVAYIDQEQSDDNISSYLKDFDDKYQAFAANYGKTVGKIIPSDIYPYFYGYANINYIISHTNSIEDYRDDGVEEAKKNIYESVKPVGKADKTNTELDEYIGLQRSIMISSIDLFAYLDKAGCVDEQKNTVKSNCGAILEKDETVAQLQSVIAESSIASLDKRSTMRSKAYSELKKLYKEIYNIEETTSGDSR